MSYKAIQHIPKGLKVLKDEQNLVIFKYKSLNRFIYTLTYLAYLVCMLFFIAFIFLVTVSNNQGYSVTHELLYMCVVALALHAISTNIWTKITVTPEYIKVKGEKYKIEYAELHSSHASVGVYKMRLEYGAQTYKLPSSRKSGIAIVNYINPIIVSIGSGNSGSSPIEIGEREQKF